MKENDKLRRRLSEIDDSLARPDCEGRDWQIRRAALEREEEDIRQRLIRLRLAPKPGSARFYNSR